MLSFPSVQVVIVLSCLTFCHVLSLCYLPDVWFDAAAVVCNTVCVYRVCVPVGVGLVIWSAAVYIVLQLRGDGSCRR